jgi:RNA polymerase sigma-70 factor, ECF subfamily
VRPTEQRRQAAGEQFAVMFREQQPGLHAYLLGRTADPAHAADLTQEVFLRAWRHLPELLERNADGRRAWLFTVARNLAVDAGRRARTQADVLASVAMLAPAGQRSAGDELQAVDDLSRVTAAIGRLPEDLRICLAMATAGELNSAGIAAALGIPAGTVRYRLSRARALLRKQLLEDDPPPESATDPPTDVVAPPDPAHRPTERHRA